MFEKARVEAIFYSNQGDKQSQFEKWNNFEYNKIVNNLNSQLDSLSAYSNFNKDQKNTIKEKTIERFFNRIPDNALIVSIINTKTNNDSSFLICYPFFSSHIMLPIKPGEVVWVFKYYNEENEKLAKIEDYNIEPKIEKCYWLSRVHGESFSEDLNYTHHDRAFMPTILRNITKDLKIPNYDDEKYSYSASNVNEQRNPTDFSFKSTTRIIVDNEDQYKNFFLGPVTRTQKNPGDLVIQGSNNNNIKLSGQIDNIGSVSLVAGKGKIQPRDPKPDELNNASSIEIERFLPNTNLSNIIKNNIGYYENLKYPNFYEENLLKDYEYSNNFEEGNIDVINDSSLINVSEKFSIIDYINLYNLTLEQNQGRINPADNVTKELEVTSNKTYEIKNIPKGFYSNSYDLPGIIAKSNNITLVSRREEDQLASGKISIIKDSRTYDNYGHFIIDKDGHVAIDGPRIIIGTLERNKELKNGEGDLIQLGQSDEMEPLVKGNHLVATLEHLIVNIQDAFNLIGEGMQALSTHTHPHPFGPTSPPVDITSNLQTINTDINSSSKIQEEMKQISGNLNKLLSKLVRTS